MRVCVYVCAHVRAHARVCVFVCMCIYIMCICIYMCMYSHTHKSIYMSGNVKIHMQQSSHSIAAYAYREYSLLYRALLQKRPINLRSLLILMCAVIS